MVATRTRARRWLGWRGVAGAWVAAFAVVLATAMLLAIVAWLRAQLPLLAPRDALGLAFGWARDVGVLAAWLACGVAAALAPFAALRGRALAAGAGAAAVLAGALLLTRGATPPAPDPRVALAPAPAPPPGHAAPATVPNLVLITIDTLRADHLDVYGYARPTAPTIAALAADGVLFERAIAAAPATQLAMASLLTGLWPWSHADPSRVRPAGAPYLRSGFATLAERLAAAGFDTGAFVANSAVRAEEGFAQGFARFDESAASAGRIEPLLEPALAWLATARAPFFLWLHVMDPHHPYDPPALAPWEDPGDARAAALRAEWSPLPSAEQTRRLQAVESERDLDPATRAFLVDRYDAEIRVADAGVARVLAALAARGADRDDTWIVLGADHGEEFLDHGRLLHGHTLYDELLHVPLVIRAPGAPRGLRVAATVSVIDVAATLLEAAGHSAADLDARSLAPFWTPGGPPPSARVALASREGKYLALVDDRHKLAVAQVPPPPLRIERAGLDTLRAMARIAFDRPHRPKVGFWPIAAEPRDPHVAAGLHAEAQRAEAALRALRDASPPRAVPEDAPIEPDAAAIERLRTLGYAE